MGNENDETDGAEEEEQDGGDVAPSFEESPNFTEIVIVHVRHGGEDIVGTEGGVATVVGGLVGELKTEVRCGAGRLAELVHGEDSVCSVDTTGVEVVDVRLDKVGHASVRVLDVGWCRSKLEPGGGNNPGAKSVFEHWREVGGAGHLDAHCGEAASFRLDEEGGRGRRG